MIKITRISAQCLSQLISAHRNWLVRLGNVHPHQFRHTFATRLVLMGIDSYLSPQAHPA